MSFSEFDHLNELAANNGIDLDRILREYAAQPTSIDEVFYLDGFDWTDLLESFCIPHYSNEHRKDTKPKQFEIRTVELDHTDYDPEFDDPKDAIDRQQLLLIWTGDRPTTQDVKDWVKENMG